MKHIKTFIKSEKEWNNFIEEITTVPTCHTLNSSEYPCSVISVFGNTFSPYPYYDHHYFYCKDAKELLEIEKELHSEA